MPTKIAVSWSALLTAYAENGKLSETRAIFDETPGRNIASWNAPMTAYVPSLRIDEVFDSFCTMPSKNSESYTVIVTGFVNVGMLDEAEKFYSEMPVAVRDPGASNALISRNELENAFELFVKMLKRVAVSWTSITVGFSKKRKMKESVYGFEKMPQKDDVAWQQLFLGFRVMENTNKLSTGLLGCSEMVQSQILSE
ncbi:pentatricopeptide repeat-containing protein At1g09410, mitochondrial-like [Aristolochia californica]|uniref:pentatricopeptide repeat-containing protein At1g09410, mitochondrial-like n=1 Tax=Aristolochia californica TaxID=171875 RepID=UPI0035D8650F